MLHLILGWIEKILGQSMNLALELTLIECRESEKGFPVRMKVQSNLECTTSLHFNVLFPVLFNVLERTCDVPMKSHSLILVFPVLLCSFKNREVLLYAHGS